jgi:hypothetical protein
MIYLLLVIYEEKMVRDMHDTREMDLEYAYHTEII